MKQWIATTAALMALVAAWRLPPEATEGGRTSVRIAEQLRFDELEGEYNLAGELYQRIRWADSLSALVVGDAEEGVVVLTPPMDGAAAEQRERLARQLDAQLRDRASADATMAVGYVFQPSDQSLPEGMRPSGRDRTETYAGTRDGRDYCLQVRVFARAHAVEMLANRLTGTDPVAPVSDHLGLCRFYVTHGFPGPSLETWLERGGAELALERGAPALPAGAELAMPSGRRWVFGFSLSFFRDRDLRAHRCTAGHADECGHIFSNPETIVPTASRHRQRLLRGSPMVGTGQSWGRTTLRDQEYILSDLETEFGREAFTRFWTSDRPMEEAFQDAFGMNVGAWMLTWVDRSMGIDAPGPAVPRSASTGAALTMALLLGIAYARNRERSVRS